MEVRKIFRNLCQVDTMVSTLEVDGCLERG